MVSKFNFVEHGHVENQIKGNRKMPQHGSKTADPLQTTTTPGVWVKWSTSTFLEHGQVEYQIKGNHECSNMVAITLAADPPPTRTYGRGQFKLKGITKCSNMIAEILQADTRPPRPSEMVSKFNFLEHGHVAYQIKRNH